MRAWSLSAVLLGWAISAGGEAAAPPAKVKAMKVRVYVGTYTDGESKGIYPLLLDTATGALTSAGAPTPSVNPSFLVQHPTGRFLYAVNETGESRTDPSGRVSAFAIEAKSGALTFLGDQPSGGAAPCHLSLDREGRFLFVANYGGGTAAVLPIAADGRLGPASVVRHEGRGPDSDRQAAPHAHAIHLDPSGERALVADLGLDRLVAYRFDAQRGTLAGEEASSVRLPPGAGPRHFAFHDQGRRLYVLNELDSTLAAFRRNASSVPFTQTQSLATRPEGFTAANYPAEIVLRADGRFLYASNRGHDSIAIFALDLATGTLSPAGHQSTLGKWPRNFAIDPTGGYLLAANQRSDSIVVFRIDGATGGLTPAGEPYRVPTPASVLMIR